MPAEKMKCSSYAECCSYGRRTGKGIALQWLLDNNIPSLAHREACLNPLFSKIGLSLHFHIIYKSCAVAELF